MNRNGLGGPKHQEIRTLLRAIGPLMVLAGVILAIVGIASFFSAFGTHEPPKRFWCVFIGVPLVGIGMGICKFAFLGTIGRYVAGEAAPAVIPLSSLANGGFDGTALLKGAAAR